MTDDAFLDLARNLARYHREHEKFYARAPLEDALRLQRTSGALKALAERWSTVEPTAPNVASPYSGAEDLNDDRATELAGILFMEVEAEPAEIDQIRRDLSTAAKDNLAVGEWLASAMETSWAVAANLLEYRLVRSEELRAELDWGMNTRAWILYGWRMPDGSYTLDVIREETTGILGVELEREETFTTLGERVDTSEKLYMRGYL